MPVMVMADDGLRAELLRKQAADRGGVYLKCERWTTYKRFIVALADAMGVSQSSTAYDIKQRILASLDENSQPLFFDHAELLKRDMFGVFRSIHDEVGVLIVLAGATPKLFELVDDHFRGGQLDWRYAPRYDFDVAIKGGKQNVDAAVEGAGVIGTIGRDQGGEGR